MRTDTELLDELVTATKQGRVRRPRMTLNTVRMDIDKRRCVKGALMPKDAGAAWIFRNGRQETRICLSHAAMDAMIKTYVVLLREEVARQGGGEWQLAERAEP